MKSRIHDYAGHLRIEVTPENYDERMLLRAFIREHAGGNALVDFVEVEGSMPIVTFGKVPQRETP